jgi:hypothetical protein
MNRELPRLALLLVLVISFTGNLPSTVHAGSPDLTVDSIWLEESSSPGQPVTAVAPGDQFLIVASIKNVGDATASGYYLDVYYDSDYGRGGPDTIASGETQVWYVGPLTAVAGAHTTKWVVDPDNQIVESDETNNLKELAFTIGSQTTTTSTTTSNSISTSTATSQTTTTWSITTPSSTSTSTTQTTSTLSASKVITSNGGASISTSQSKFGGASGLFDGTDGYLTSPDSDDWYLARGDFTIDFWVRFNALPTSGNAMAVFSQYTDNNNYVVFRLSNSAGTYSWILAASVSSSSTIYDSKNSPGLSTNVWYHIALVRSGDYWYIFQGGTLCGSTYSNSNEIPNESGSLLIGAGKAGGYPSYYVNGWLDEYRVSKGIARWTNNFAPPTAPYVRDSNTVLLLHMDGVNGSTTFSDDSTSQTTTTSTSSLSSTSTVTTQTTVTATTPTTTTSYTSTTTTSSPVSVSITVAANPAGSIVVDGTAYTSSHAFAWVPGSSHTVSANSPVSGDSGTQYVWASWSDGGDQSHTITTPSSPTTYTANYQTQFQVTYSQMGCSLPVSLPATEWVNTNGSAVGSFATTVRSGDGKTQCTLQSSVPAGPINAPTARAATYKTQYYLTVASSYGNPAGQGWYDAGSTATFTVTSPVSGGAGTQGLFTGWFSNDTGGYAGMDTSHSVTMGSPITETASWKTQWQVTFVVNPSAGGSITVNGQPAATSWYDDGAVVNIQANSNAGYVFSSWSNGGAASITFANSTSASTTVSIHGSGTITAEVTVSGITVVTLLDSSGNGLSGGVVQYYSGGWKSFGTTGSAGTVGMVLKPGTYTFRITYAGATGQKSQDVSKDPNVKFQTVQVHSDSGKCTSYYSGGSWRTFTQDMQLLPGTYTFRFSDGTANKSFKIVVGRVNHIH